MDKQWTTVATAIKYCRTDLSGIAMPDASLPESPAPVELNQIRLDAGTQSRLGGNDTNTVRRYAEEMQGGLWDFERSPLPLLFFDGEAYYPGDGHHRIQAALMSGLTQLQCDIKPGGQREAQFYSNTEANKYHGKQLTRKDKRNRVHNLLMDEEWQLMSDREIARKCGVSAPFVGSVRKELVQKNQISADSRRKGKDGKIRDTKKIGRVKVDASKPGSPTATPIEDPLTSGDRVNPTANSTAGPTGPSATPLEAQPSGPAHPEGPGTDPAYAEILRERNELMKRLTLQQEIHQKEIERLTAESLLGRNNELEQALADDEALMQQIYDGLGTIREVLEPERPAKDLRLDVQKAARGIDLMRRILEAQAPNLVSDEYGES